MRPDTDLADKTGPPTAIKQVAIAVALLLVLMSISLAFITMMINGTAP